MTTYTIVYIDDTVLTLQQSSITLLHDIPTNPPQGDYTHYVHLTATGLQRVKEMTVTLAPGEIGGNLVIAPASGPLKEQRANLAIGTGNTPSQSLMWSDLGNSLRLDFAPAAGTTTSVEISDPGLPPVKLRVVVIRP